MFITCVCSVTANMCLVNNSYIPWRLLKLRYVTSWNDWSHIKRRIPRSIGSKLANAHKLFLIKNVSMHGLILILLGRFVTIFCERICQVIVFQVMSDLLTKTCVQKTQIIDFLLCDLGLDLLILSHLRDTSFHCLTYLHAISKSLWTCHSYWPTRCHSCWADVIINCLTLDNDIGTLFLVCHTSLSTRKHTFQVP